MKRMTLLAAVSVAALFLLTVGAQRASADTRLYCASSSSCSATQPASNLRLTGLCRTR